MCNGNISNPAFYTGAAMKNGMCAKGTVPGLPPGLQKILLKLAFLAFRPATKIIGLAQEVDSHIIDSQLFASHIFNKPSRGSSCKSIGTLFEFNTPISKKGHRISKDFEKDASDFERFATIFEDIFR